MAVATGSPAPLKYLSKIKIIAVNSTFIVAYRQNKHQTEGINVPEYPLSNSLF
jgi:hypothetical protein